MFLYAITNLVNGKRYIGIAKDYKRRWYQHRSGYGSKIVYSAIKKYVIGKFDFTVVCRGTEEYVEEMELRAIRKLITKTTLRLQSQQRWRSNYNWV